jgi:hypothetical protein
MKDSIRPEFRRFYSEMEISTALSAAQLRIRRKRKLKRMI